MHHSTESSHINHVGVAVLVFILGSMVGYYVGAAYQAESNGLSAYDQSYFFGIKKKSTVTTKSTTADPTADWKTYTNDSLGFSFKYPSLFTITSSGDAGTYQVNFEYPTGGLSRGGYVQSDIDDTVASATDFYARQTGFTSKGTRLIGGQTWYAYEYNHKDDPSNTDAGNSITYFVFHNNHLYKFNASTEGYKDSANPSIGRTDDQVKSDINLMLESFKFTK